MNKTPTARTIHIGGTGLVPVLAEGRWKIDSLSCNLADVSQKIVLPTERWRITFTVERFVEGGGTLTKLFGPGAEPPHVVAIFGLHGEESPPARPFSLADGSVTDGAAWIRLNTGDEFLATKCAVTPLDGQAAVLMKIDGQTTPEAFEKNYNRTLHNRDPKNNRPGPRPKYTKRERRDAVDAMRVLVKQGASVTDAVANVQKSKGLWHRDCGYWRDEYYRMTRKPKKKPRI